MYCFNLAPLCHRSSLFSSISSFHLPPPPPLFLPSIHLHKAVWRNVERRLYFNPLVRIVLLSAHSPAPLSPPATRLRYLFFFSSDSDNQLDLVRRWVKPCSKFYHYPFQVCLSLSSWRFFFFFFFPSVALRLSLSPQHSLYFPLLLFFIMRISGITLYLPPFFCLFSSVNFLSPFVPRIQSLSPSSTVWIYSIVSVHIRQFRSRPRRHQGVPKCGGCMLGSKLRVWLGYKWFLPWTKHNFNKTFYGIK